MFGSELIRFIVLLTVFASIFLLAQVLLRSSLDNRAHAGAINKRLKMIATGTDRAEIIGSLRKHDPTAVVDLGLLTSPYESLRRNLMMAGVPLGIGQTLMVMAAVFAGVVLIVSLMATSFGFSFTGGIIQMILAVAASVAIALPIFAINFLAARRRKLMQEQFPVALDIFVRALRSGHPVSSAIDLLTHEMEDPIGSEFGLVSDEVSYGADLTAALEDMAERWDLDDLRMFVTSLSVQNETGGNLAEILDNLSKVVRERAALYLKVRALSSEGRMTGWVLTLAPIVTFVVLFSSNPQFYLEVASDPIFYIGFPLVILWYLFGVYVIRRMVNIKV